MAQWLMRVEGALEAHFNQDEGPSLPGVEWAIGLKHGQETATVRVRSYLAADATSRTRADHDYQARTVMQYLDDQIARGWHPGAPREHVITIGNPFGAPTEPAKKPWWRFW